MKSWLTLLFLFSTAFLLSGAQAEVYKHTNPDGSVSFSDVPDKSNSQPIKLSPSSTYKAPPLPPAPPPVKPKAKEDAGDYESIAISSPANDSAIRENTGNLTVSIEIKPALKTGHSYVLLLDGKNVSESDMAEILLTNIDRGSHTLIVQVVDKDKTMIIQSSPVTVHLQRFSTPPG